MDLGAYWQENRRFVLGVAGGVLFFFGGLYAVHALYGEDLRTLRAQRTRTERELAEPLYARADLDAAESEHGALVATVESLAAAVAFEPREGFRLREGAGSASSQYHQIVGRVRDDLRPAASRANLRLDDTLGLPALSPTQPAEIERTLAALDVVERVARVAMAERVERLEDVRIELDPALRGQGGAGPIERTRVRLRLTGTGLSLLRLLAALQAGPEPPLLVEELEMLPSRGREDDVRLDLSLVVARLTLDGGV